MNFILAPSNTRDLNTFLKPITIASMAKSIVEIEDTKKRSRKMIETIAHIKSVIDVISDLSGYY